MVTDYSSLEMTFLTYVYQCIAQGKTTELEELGIDVEDMKLIRKLPIMDIARTRKSSACRVVKSVKLDRAVLKDMQAQASRSAAENEIVDLLVEAGAHHRMVHHFFGITKAELSTRRKMLNVSLRGRRPQGKRLTAKDHVVVHDYVTQHIECFSKMNRQKSTYQCKALLSTAELTDLPVSAIWDAVDRAEQNGAFDWAA